MVNWVQVFALSFGFDSLIKKARKVALRVLELLNKRGLSLEIYLVNSKEMRALNQKFRGKDRATDVLSFEAVSPTVFYEPKVGRARNFRSVGEIYLDPGHIKIKKETLERMLVHGVLHLLGYDHKKAKETTRMEKLEQKLLRVLMDK